MNRSAFHRSCSWLTPLAAALALGCVGERDSRRAPSTLGEDAAQQSRPGFAFSHDNSREERWPFGLNDVTTKFIAEPAREGELAASYWVVRSEPGYAPPPGELRAEFRVRPEFPASPFEPVRERDYELVLGADSSGAIARTLGPENIEVLSPAASAARQRGFIVRARFPGDSTPHEPPKSLLIELVAVRDADGRELPLGEPRVARWLIVEPASSPPATARAELSR